MLDKAAKNPILVIWSIKRLSRAIAVHLSTTFAAGVPLIDALESTAGATNNVVYEKP